MHTSNMYHWAAGVRQSSECLGGDMEEAEAEAARVCAVCGEVIKRHDCVHYGGLSCYSCRAFFRRLSQETALAATSRLKCRLGHGRCVVSVAKRKECQRCRYDKCLAAGMRPERVLNPEAKEARFRTYFLKKKLQKEVSKPLKKRKLWSQIAMLEENNQMKQHNGVQQREADEGHEQSGETNATFLKLEHRSFDQKMIEELYQRKTEWQQNVNRERVSVPKHRRILPQPFKSSCLTDAPPPPPHAPPSGPPRSNTSPPIRSSCEDLLSTLMDSASSLFSSHSRLVLDHSAAGQRLVSCMAGLHNGSVRLSRQDFTLCAHMHRRIFASFARSVSSFAALAPDDQAALLERNARLLFAFVLAKYFSASCGSEQLSWMVGESEALRRSSADSSGCLVPFCSFLNAVRDYRPLSEPEQQHAKRFLDHAKTMSRDNGLIGGKAHLALVLLFHGEGLALSEPDRVAQMHKNCLYLVEQHFGDAAAARQITDIVRTLETIDRDLIALLWHEREVDGAYEKSGLVTFGHESALSNPRLQANLKAVSAAQIVWDFRPALAATESLREEKMRLMLCADVRLSVGGAAPGLAHTLADLGLSRQALYKHNQQCTY